MLQDVEAGRATEVEALVGSVVELGRMTQTPTPHIDTSSGADTFGSKRAAVFHIGRSAQRGPPDLLLRILTGRFLPMRKTS
jgi:hypothetical protein